MSYSTVKELGSDEAEDEFYNISTSKDENNGPVLVNVVNSKKLEYLRGGWTKKDKQEQSPYIMKMIQFFNQLSLWLQYLIVSESNVKERAVILTYVLKLAAHFYKLQNYNCLQSIISTIEAAAIHRLKNTFDKVKPTIKAAYEESYKFMSSDNGYKTYRAALSTIEPPLVPYLGMYLTDLLNITEGNKKTMEPMYPDYLNFQKAILLDNFVLKIQKQQMYQYMLLSVDTIQKWVSKQLKKFGNNTEDQLYEFSLKAEPRSKSK